ncbi:MAG TPA: hypothetical protein ENK38_02405 [Gammaproteobacteria bacterium]|nr:hypothetical protein [Gammaproteobacteria bacterium]
MIRYKDVAFTLMILVVGWIAVGAAYAEIGGFSLGTHTIKMVIEADHDVAESNEKNDEYSYIFTVR